MTDTTSVKVAVRVRPLVSSEIHKGCKEIVEVIPQNEQIIIRSCDNKAFTFNYVLGSNSSQEELYTRCVAPLLKSLFEGFNVTIFAYGQTGSGKTHSMGTVYTGEENMGVIPRAVHEIFSYIQDNFSIDFNVSVSFTELYREVLYDLLANKPRDQCILELREDASKGIYIPNLSEIRVDSAQDILDILVKGSQGRVTASTNMNAHSSRSHSIFTINIAMQHKTKENQNKTAKLHLVDLAGSERPKKTGAQGTTFKEGIDINKGLFVLGNVISALGDEKTQNGFIPYRDSNLTRLLKDSLGGNSVTLMIACVSPADYNLEETISTLRYADRARKIKNKPIVNQDPKIAEINELRRLNKQLQLQIVGQGGPIVSASELDDLKSQNAQSSLRIKELMVELSSALLDKTGLHEKLLILQGANEGLNKKLLHLKEQYDFAFSEINKGVESEDMQAIKDTLVKMQEIQEHFVVLQSDQIKTEKEIRQHEETFTVLVETARKSAGTSKDFIEEEESHATTQMALHSQLQTVSKQLHLKEELARQLTANTRNMIDEAAMLEYEAKIDALEKEREQLRNAKINENTNKVAEQRRKRLQELEEQLKELKKKVLEQARLLKLKEKDEQKIQALHKEISSMKSTKVELLKRMRTESDKFRSWKQNNERELARVKQQQQKKETEMVKMKLTYEKQKNVLKRKFEEAASLNKRLQNTLVKRKQAQQMRFTGKIERLVPWLKEEVDIYVDIVEAECVLSGLLEDRGTLQQQLEELKNNPETADSPEIKAIEEDIELRSVQIQDIQQKLLDSDEENKAKTRFDSIQTMVEAKFALRTLFNLLAEFPKEKNQIKREYLILKESQKDLLNKVDQLALEKKITEDRVTNQIASLEQAYQEKVGILLTQMRGIKNEDVNPESELHERCNILSERIEHLEDQVRDKDNVIACLKKKLEDIEKASLMAKTPEIRKPQKKVKVTHELPDEQSAIEMVDDIDISLDDLQNDPDWRNTPLAKRLITGRNNHSKLLRASRLQNTNELTIPGGSKRSSEGGCTCKTSCNTVRCGCRKTKKGCGSTCKCNEEVCVNRGDDVSTLNDQGDSSLESTSSDNAAGDSSKRPRSQLNSSASRTPYPRKILRVYRYTISSTPTVDELGQITTRKLKQNLFGSYRD